jgi:hypothetical protein
MAKLCWARNNELQRMRQHGAVSLAAEREEELRRSLPQHRPRRFRARLSKATLRQQCEDALREWQSRPARPPSKERPPWE